MKVYGPSNQFSDSYEDVKYPDQSIINPQKKYQGTFENQFSETRPVNESFGNSNRGIQLTPFHKEELR